MADNDLKILITGNLNTGKTIGEINKQIKNIINKANLQKVKLNVEIDSKTLNKLNIFSQSVEKITQQQKQQSQIITNNAKIEQNAIKQTTSEYGKLIKQIEILDANKQKVKLARTYKDTKGIETTINTSGDGNPTQYRVVDNIEKLKLAELKAQSQIQNAIAQTERTRRLELEKSAKTQAKFANKAIEDNYKIRQSLELYKQKMLGGNGFSGELDIFSTKQKGRYDEDSLKNIRKEIMALNIDTPDLNNKIKVLNTQFSSLKLNASEAGSVLTRAMENAFKFARFYLVGGGIVTVVNSFKNAIAYVSQLDNSLNEIRIVTNKTQDEVESLAKSYNNLAKEMSVTTAELAGTAADLFRQGLDEGQVEERMKAIVQYAKISAISVDESNKIITATANATGESVQKITDVFAYLGKQNCPLVA